MSSREEILASIRKHTQTRYEKPDIADMKRLTYPDKMEQFCAISRAVGGTAVGLGEGEDVNAVIRRTYPDAMRIASVLPDISCATFNPDNLDDPKELDGTDVAVVKGEIGVAENGAIWIPQAVKYKAIYFISEKLVILLDRNKIVDTMYDAYRELDGQDEKRNPIDFALWKCAQPEHIMRWPSPWSDGFPGWHCECTAMGKKYLGEHFDIHGGGMDLIFPHHECEIAQAVASQGEDMVHYWMHNNMITINGQKMGKSLGNFITLEEFFTGDNKVLSQAYSPMTIRFFILQAHYRSTVDFSNEALQAAEKGLERLMDAYNHLMKLKASDVSTVDVKDLRRKCYDAMNDDLNSPIVIAHLFDAARAINSVKDGKATISAEDLKGLQDVFHTFVFDILGIKDEAASGGSNNNEAFGKAMDLLLTIRQQAKANKDWATSDKIRNELTAIGFDIKDTKDGAEWKLSK